MAKMLDLLIANAHLATPKGNEPKIGAAQGEICIEAGINIGMAGGKIAYIGRDAPGASKVYDAGGRLLTPGLVDCHTHLVFGGVTFLTLSRILKNQEKIIRLSIKKDKEGGCQK